MGQRIKRFDFVSRDPPQVGFESRVMGHYPARLSRSQSEILFRFDTSTYETHLWLSPRPGKAKGRWWEFGESRADRVSSFKRRYRRRTKQSERPGVGEKSRVDQARRSGEAKRNQDLAEKEARLWIP
ncbi:UNVERIFIED_CONTAM: hypothetical protein Scaly_3114100 [Sesamum calycinum]|uniref:Uncharacterized protein n=1 Tax=Sesamum calycinum TaxID=2727403 RepID=A0AAW2JMK5_9LAMI